MNNSPRNELQAQVAAILKLCPQDPGASAAPVSDNETLHRLPAQSSHARHPSGVPRILPPVLEPPSLGYDRRTATPDGTQYGVDRASTSDKGLQTNDSSEKLDFRPLKRSPTFSDEGMREGSLPQQWSPSRQANVEKSSSDYWSDTREETNPCSTPPTSFNPSEIGSSPCPPAVHNRESDFRGIGGGVPLDDNDLDDSIYTVRTIHHCLCL
jgi:hypothetical protein